MLLVEQQERVMEELEELVLFGPITQVVLIMAYKVELVVAVEEDLPVLVPVAHQVRLVIMELAVAVEPVEVQVLQLEVLVLQEQTVLLLLPILRLLFRVLQTVMILPL